MITTFKPEIHRTPNRELLVAEAESITQCLTYLEIEANKLGLGVTAHLIAVAAESIRDTIAQTRGDKFKCTETRQ